MIGGAYSLLGDGPGAERVLREAIRRFLSPDPLRARMVTDRPDGLDPGWLLLSVLQRRDDPAAEALRAYLQAQHPRWTQCPGLAQSQARFGSPCGMHEVPQNVGGFDHPD